MVREGGEDRSAPSAPPPEYPVGLRILGLWGSPLRRLGLYPQRPSVFLLPAASSVLLFGTIYLIGALLAAHEGVLRAFVASPLVPCLLLATAWSATWIAWASAVYQHWMARATGPNAPDSPTPSLPRLTDELRAKLATHWSRLCSLRTSALYALPCIAVFVTYAYVAIYPPWGLPHLASPSILSLFGYPNHGYWMFVYLATTAAILADVGSYGLFFTFEHLRFVSEFVQYEEPTLQSGSSDTVRAVYLARKPLDELASASFLSSMAWFGVVTLLVAAFVVDLNVLTFVGIAALVGVGLYVFLRPQWEFHRLIRSAKEAALARLERSLGEDWYEQGTNAPKREHLPTLVLAQNVAAMGEWHIDVRLVVAQIVGAVLPFVAALATGPLGLSIA